MAADAEELSRRVLDDFEARIQNDRFATRYNDIAMGSIKASEGAEELRKTSIRDLQGALHAIKDDLPENIDYEYAKKLYEPVLRRAFEIHSDIAREAQQEKNEEAGLGLKAQAADFPEDKIDGFAKAVSKYENKKDGFWLMDKPIDHFIRSTYDDTVKKNAEFQSKAGLRPRIIRKASADACEWCRAMAGTYDYPDKVPHDVYRRHENCTCTVEYDPGSGKRVQNAWTKRWTREEERDKIETRKRLGGVALRKAEINLPDIEIGRSIGAKAHNEDIMDLETGEIFHFAEGTKIQNIQIFAGKGTKAKLRIAGRYAKRYGGRPEDWQHVKGFGTLATDDGDRKAEVHWLQCEGIGRFEFFAKEWLD